MSIKRRALERTSKNFASTFDQDDFGFKNLIRDFLKKCSGDKIVEMLKNILSEEEKSLLIKVKDSFQIKTEPMCQHDETNYFNNFPFDLPEFILPEDNR